QPNYTFTFVNQAFCRYYQKQREDCLGTSFLRTIVEEERGNIIQHLRSLDPQHSVVTFCHRNFTPDSISCWQQWTYRGLFDDEGILIEIQCVGKDITEQREAQLALEEAKRVLEERVEERTAALRHSNEKLRQEILERKRSELALRESEERYRLIADNATDLITRHDPEDGTFLYLSPACKNLLGYEPEELLGQSCYSLFHPEDLPKLHGNHLSVLNEPIVGLVTYRIRRKDGNYIWFETTSQAIQNPKTGKAEEVIAVSRNISDRKEMEQQLRETTALQRAILDGANYTIISTTPDGMIETFNLAAERLLGYTAIEVVGKATPLIFHDLEEIKQRSQALSEELGILIEPNFRIFTAKAECGEVDEQEWTYICKDGTRVPVLLSITALRDSDGNIMGFVGIGNDITQRKQAEQELLMTKERLQYLLSSSPAVIYSCKANGDYGATFMSENAASLVGYQAQEFTNDSSFWTSHIHPEDAPRVFANLPHVFEQEYHTHEYRFLHKDGHYRWLYDEIKLVKDAEGNPVEMIGYWADITQRKQLEEELVKALEKEKELNELKSRFVSMTSHEFRTPLSTILSSAELLEHYSSRWSKEKQLLHLHRIQGAVQHMTQMLNDILIIGKADAGKLEFNPTSVNLIEFCQNLVEELKLTIQTGHAIALHIEDCCVNAIMDEKLLRHIFSNLISNAIKYSEAGSLINFSLNCDEQYAYFQVQDPGIGIPAQDQPHLFESFYRATNVGNIQGTGLGLSIVKKCVNFHRGHIDVVSEENQGTRFIVTLPLDPNPTHSVS
ncbi:MAG: PAS domain S-box protein, partial [Halothece sp.]